MHKIYKFKLLLASLALSFSAFSQTYEAVYKGTLTIAQIGGLKIYVTYNIKADSNWLYVLATPNGNSMPGVKNKTENEEALFDIKKGILYKFDKKESYLIQPKYHYEITNLRKDSTAKRSIKKNIMVKVDKNIPAFIQPMPTLHGLPFGVTALWKKNLVFKLVSFKKITFDFTKQVKRVANFPPTNKVLDMFDN